MIQLTFNDIGALLALTAMEIVLGIDNVVFLSILVSKVPSQHREKVRKAGILLALIARIALLFSISWIMGLTKPWFSVMDKEVSGKNLILLFGGLFLMVKSTHEIHVKLEGENEKDALAASGVKKKYGSVFLQIVLLDLVFSLDSVITAVGMAQQTWIMVFSMLAAVIVMFIFSKSIGDFVERHPTVKMLALAFLLMIGLMLVLDGMSVHVSKGYLYFAMAFSLGVEFLNMKYQKKKTKAR